MAGKTCNGEAGCARDGQVREDPSVNVRGPSLRTVTLSTWSQLRLGGVYTLEAP
jgi:hypothetical protein